VNALHERPPFKNSLKTPKNRHKIGELSSSVKTLYGSHLSLTKCIISDKISENKILISRKGKSGGTWKRKALEPETLVIYSSAKAVRLSKEIS